MNKKTYKECSYCGRPENGVFNSFGTAISIFVGCLFFAIGTLMMGYGMGKFEHLLGEDGSAGLLGAIVGGGLFVCAVLLGRFIQRYSDPKRMKYFDTPHQSGGGTK